MIGANIVTLSTKVIVPELTKLKIQLTGVKNPTFVGSTTLGDINIAINDASGNKINKGDFNQLTYIAAKNVDQLYLTVESSSLY